MADESITQTKDETEKNIILKQFVKEVTDFSSQYGSENSVAYAASNLEGVPTIYPRYGDFTQACVLRTYGPWWLCAPSSPLHNSHISNLDFSQDFVECKFEKAVFPRQIDIYETYHPGAVVRILAYNPKHNQSNRWLTLWSGEPKKQPQKTSVFSPPLRFCPFSTNLIRLELNSILLDYYGELDAVCLHGQVDPCHDQKTDSPNTPPPARPGSPSAPQPRGRPTTDPTVSAVDDGSVVSDTRSLAAQHGSSSATNLTESCDSRVSTQLDHLHLCDGLTAVLDVSSNGYFDKLPEEVIQVLVSYLDFPSKCSLASTCHLLYKHCYDPLQYTELDLQPYWTRVTNVSLDGLQKRCKHLQNLNLAWCGDHSAISPEKFNSFLSVAGSELTTLNVACCKFLDGRCLQSIAKWCPNLQDVDIQSCRELDHIDLLFVRKLTKLTKLNLYRCRIDIETLVSIIRACPDLMDLNVGSCHNIRDFDLAAIELAKNCPNLRSLDLWRARTLSDKGLIQLASNCRLLEDLDLGWCSDLRSSTGCFDHLAKSCRYLKKLFLTANRTVCDADLIQIAMHCPLLEQLDLLGTKEISYNGTVKILESCRHLRFLDVSFCAGIDFAVVHNWKKQFPHVAIKKSYQNT